MKKILTFLFSLVAIVCCHPNMYDIKYVPSQDEGKIIPTAFTRGVNLAGSFEVGTSGTAENIWMGYINDETFKFLKELGCDVVRVPMQFGQFITSRTNYALQDAYWEKLDVLLDLGDKYGITVIIDNHQWGYCDMFPEDHALSFLKSIWSQVAKHCKARTNVVYELQNEPDGDWWRDNWHETQAELITEIRKIDDIHDIIVCAAPYHSLSEIPEYDDAHLIYTAHMYSPFVFTHQGASWTGLGDLSLHFPYSKEDNLSAPVPENYQAELLNYAFYGTETYVRQVVDGVANEIARRNAKCFIGEFGAINVSMDSQSRNNWHECVRKAMEEHGISWTLWSFTREFGLFKNTNSAIVNYEKDLDVDLVRALGFDIPPAYQEHEIDESDFGKVVLYDDGFGPLVSKLPMESFPHLTIPCYEDPAPNSENCVKWICGDAWQNYLPFWFTSSCADLSVLEMENSYLRFKFKCMMDKPQNLSFGIWFINNKDSFEKPEQQHNWVKQYRVTAADVTADGQWHQVSIPIKYFSFRSAEDVPDISSEQYFTWSKMKEIDFCSFEDGSNAGNVFYLDDIVITGPKNREWVDPGTKDGMGVSDFDENKFVW